MEREEWIIGSVELSLAGIQLYYHLSSIHENGITAVLGIVFSIKRGIRL